MLNGTPLFFSNRDGQWFPTLRLLHQYPDMMKKVCVDEGAIKFVLSGANIMCPGLTSPGAKIHDEVITILCSNMNSAECKAPTIQSMEAGSFSLCGPLNILFSESQHTWWNT